VSAVGFGAYLLQGAAPGLGGAERRSIRRIPQMYRRTQHSEVKILILSGILNFSTLAGNARHGLSSCPAKGRTGRSGAVLLDRRRRFTRVARSWRLPVSAWMEGRTMGFEQAVAYALKDGRDTG
jgi:hypothetical protein